MKHKLAEIFGREKFIIGGVHLLALPGTPGYDSSGSMGRIIDRATEDAVKLEQGGVDGILFTNESDTPYEQHVGPEVVAAVTRCVVEVAARIRVPFGVNMLLDPVAAIAIAHAAGGRFVRGYFAGSYVGDISFMDSRGAEALRFRRNIGAENVAVMSNITCGFGASLDPRDLSAVAHGVIVHARVDAVVVSGLAAGRQPDYEAVARAEEGAEGTPVILGTGGTKENIHKFLEIVDGAIVATALREEGQTLNPVDLSRVKEFMRVVREFSGK